MMLQARQELEKIRRKLETELNDVKEQLIEKCGQLADLQAQMHKREEEIQQAFNRCVYCRPLQSNTPRISLFKHQYLEPLFFRFKIA